MRLQSHRTPGRHLPRSGSEHADRRLAPSGFLRRSAPNVEGIKTMRLERFTTFQQARDGSGDGLHVVDAPEHLRGLVVVDPSGHRIGEMECLLAGTADGTLQMLVVASGGLMGLARVHRLVPVHSVVNVDDRIRVAIRTRPCTRASPSTSNALATRCRCPLRRRCYAVLAPMLSRARGRGAVRPVMTSDVTNVLVRSRRRIDRGFEGRVIRRPIGEDERRSPMTEWRRQWWRLLPAVPGVSPPQPGRRAPSAAGLRRCPKAGAAWVARRGGLRRPG